MFIHMTKYGIKQIHGQQWKTNNYNTHTIYLIKQPKTLNDYDDNNNNANHDDEYNMVLLKKLKWQSTKYE